jgi:hypothetical protein
MQATQRLTGTNGSKAAGRKPAAQLVAAPADGLPHVIHGVPDGGAASPNRLRPAVQPRRRCQLQRGDCARGGHAAQVRRRGRAEKLQQNLLGQTWGWGGVMDVEHGANVWVGGWGGGGGARAVAPARALRKLGMCSGDPFKTA